jgi:hypothetical protein
MGKPQRGECVKEGMFADWQVQYEKPDCLRRGFTFGQRVSTWTDARQLGYIVRETNDFTEFRELIEFGIHAQVHDMIGGDMSTMYSPNDPMFFLHHSNIDRLWAEWQRVGGGRTYSGPQTVAEFGEVSKVLNTFDQCYDYTTPNTNTDTRKQDKPSVEKWFLDKVFGPLKKVLKPWALKLPELPKALSPEFIKQMMYDESDVRRVESKLKSFHAKVDSLINLGTFLPGPGIPKDAKAVDGYGAYPPVKMPGLKGFVSGKLAASWNAMRSTMQVFSDPFKKHNATSFASMYNFPKTSGNNAQGGFTNAGGYDYAYSWQYSWGSKWGAQAKI